MMMMTDEVQATIAAANADASQAPAADAPALPMGPQVGDELNGRAIFGVRKVDDDVFVAFDADCVWLPLAGFQPPAA
jgi:hypothetical protein